MGLKEIRDALGAQIESNLPGLRAITRMRQLMPPCAVVELDRIEYHDASMSEPLYRFRIQLILSTNDLEAAIRQMDELLEPDSGIRYALEVDPTLGDVVGDTTVTSADDVSGFTFEGSNYLGVRFLVDIRP